LSITPFQSRQHSSISVDANPQEAESAHQEDHIQDLNRTVPFPNNTTAAEVQSTSNGRKKRVYSNKVSLEYIPFPSSVETHNPLLGEAEGMATVASEMSQQDVTFGWICGLS
jgi:hypothetical protein